MHSFGLLVPSVQVHDRHDRVLTEVLFPHVAVELEKEVQEPILQVKQGPSSIAMLKDDFPPPHFSPSSWLPSAHLHTLCLVLVPDPHVTLLDHLPHASQVQVRLACSDPYGLGPYGLGPYGLGPGL